MPVRLANGIFLYVFVSRHVMVGRRRLLVRSGDFVSHQYSRFYSHEPYLFLPYDCSKARSCALCVAGDVKMVHKQPVDTINKIDFERSIYTTSEQRFDRYRISS